MRTFEIVTGGAYNLFFLLALMVGSVLAWNHGRRNGMPSAEWAALLAMVVASGIVGARLLHFEPGAGPGAKTILGAVLLGTVTLFAGMRFLRIRPAADSLAIALPVGFAIGRIGCLLAGCCFGHPTELPWGVVYDERSAAFRAQVAAGLISAESVTSLAVHPTQIYEALLAVAIAACVPWVARHVRREGSVLLSVILGLGSGRLVLEFFRARDIATFAGLTRVQWMIAALLGVIALVLAIRERMPSAQATPTLSPSARFFRLTCVTGTPIFLLLAGGAFFAPMEGLVLTLVSVPPFLLLVRAWLDAGRDGAYRLASPWPVTFALTFLTAQQLPSPSGSAEEAAGPYPIERWSWGLSVAQSEDEEDRIVGMSSGDCGGPLYDSFDVRYRLVGTSLTRTKRTGPTEGHVFRLRGFAGEERAISAEESGSTSKVATTTSLGGVGTSMTLDRRIFGVTGGLAVGSFSGDTASANVAVTLGLRVGNLDGLHAFGGINEVEPMGIRDPIVRTGLGYKFGPTGSRLEAGVWEGGRPFVGGTLAGRGFEISPSAVIDKNPDIRISVNLTTATRP